MRPSFVAPLASLVGRRVDIYLNLHKPPGTYSLRAAGGDNDGRVVGYARALELGDCEFKVSAAGVARIRQLKRKEVCAVVRGTLISAYPESEALRSLAARSLLCSRTIRFNPYFTDTFVDAASGEPIWAADKVFALGCTLLVP